MIKITIIALCSLFVLSCEQRNNNIYKDNFYNEYMHEGELQRLPLIKPHYLIKLNGEWYLNSEGEVNGKKDIIFLEKIKEVGIKNNEIFFYCKIGDDHILNQEKYNYFKMEGNSLIGISNDSFSLNYSPELKNVDGLWKEFKNKGKLSWLNEVLEN